MQPRRSTPEDTNLKRLLGRENLAQELTGPDTQSIAQDPDFLYVVLGTEGSNVRLEVGFRGELQALPLEGKDLCRVGHY